jgi:diguanylate cyclase (GGDEF)-like protein
MEGDHDIFTAEESLLREGETLVASGSFSSPVDRERYERLLAGYRTLLAQTRHMVSISDRMEGELNRASNKFAELSNLDALTGLFNRRWFDEALPKDWKRAVRAGSPVSLAMLDIDHFKLYNDRHGHVEGDVCLRAVGGVLDGALKRPGDWAVRYGGEEFALWLPDTGPEGASLMAEGIRAKVEALGEEGAGLRSTVTISIGLVSVVPEHRLPWLDLVRAADRALYEAKAAGRNRVVAKGTA